MLDKYINNLQQLPVCINIPYIFIIWSMLSKFIYWVLTLYRWHAETFSISKLFGLFKNLLFNTWMTNFAVVVCGHPLPSQVWNFFSIICTVPWINYESDKSLRVKHTWNEVLVIIYFYIEQTWHLLSSNIMLTTGNIESGKYKPILDFYSMHTIKLKCNS